MEITPVAPVPAELPRARVVARDGGAAEASHNAVESIAPPSGHRLSGATLAGLALAAGAAAIVLGSIAFVLGMQRESTPVPAAPQRLERAVAFLVRPTTRLIPLGAAGAVVAIDERGRGYLVPRGLPVAPAGKTYALWASVGGRRPTSSAVFRGDEAVVPLAAPLPKGALVTVTEERAGGTAEPRGSKVLVARVPG